MSNRNRLKFIKVRISGFQTSVLSLIPDKASKQVTSKKKTNDYCRSSIRETKQRRMELPIVGRNELLDTVILHLLREAIYTRGLGDIRFFREMEPRSCHQFSK